MTEKLISRDEARAIALAWARVDEPDIHVDVIVEPVENGYAIESVVYCGEAPFELIGRAQAFINARGRVEERAAA